MRGRFEEGGGRGVMLGVGKGRIGGRGELRWKPANIYIQYKVVITIPPPFPQISAIIHLESPYALLSLSSQNQQHIKSLNP